MKDNSPWSVEGMDPEVRQAAESAAAEAGVSLGTWLSHIVRQGTGPGKPVPGQASMAGGEALAGAVDSLTAAVAEMSARLEGVISRKGPARVSTPKSRSGRLVGVLAVLTVVLLVATAFLWRQILFPAESERVVADVADVTALAEAEPVALAAPGLAAAAKPVAGAREADQLRTPGQKVTPVESGQEAKAPDLSPDHANRELAWIKDSAERGLVSAQERLGLAYLTGRDGVARDYSQAHIWFERAAAQKSAEALFQLGVMHEKGLGVVPSDEAAALWYEQATALDHPPALHNLAVMQAQGRGVAQDYLVAAELFSRAAERNLAISQYNLGVLYETGRGVEQDFLEAYRWYSLAAKQGNRGAVARRDAVAAQLMPAELAEAQQLAADWRPLASGAGAASATPLPADHRTADRDAAIVD